MDKIKDFLEWLDSPTFGAIMFRHIMGAILGCAMVLVGLIAGLYLISSI